MFRAIKYLKIYEVARYNCEKLNVPTVRVLRILRDQKHTYPTSNNRKDIYLHIYYLVFDIIIDVSENFMFRYSSDSIHSRS